MKTPKIFDHQPELNKENIESLRKKGLLAPIVDSENRRNGPIVPKDDVLGYVRLCEALKLGKVTQDDARLLLVIESTRANGRPRESHIVRLLPFAFAESKAKAKANIELARKEAWRKNQELNA